MQGKRWKRGNVIKSSHKIGKCLQKIYSFNATLSGLTAKDDRISHNGNYEVT